MQTATASFPPPQIAPNRAHFFLPKSQSHGQIPKSREAEVNSSGKRFIMYCFLKRKIPHLLLFSRVMQCFLKTEDIAFCLPFSSIVWHLKQNLRSMETSPFSYHKCVHFALEETRRRTDLTSLPSQYKCMKAMDGKTDLQALSFQAPKVRFLRSLTIDSGQSMQVLDFAAFPEPEYDLPIFCANFFTSSSVNIIVLDLNPLHDVINRSDYKDKYYKNLLGMGQKYAALLPWGDKITSESLKFFSPIVIWTKFPSTQSNHDILYSAFTDYFKAWLEIMDHATAETDASQILFNCEAQHKYLTWRAEKDPGHQLLKRLLGETHEKNLVKKFLFNGVDTLGTKTFLDYFPEYRCEDGTINKKRSIIGKSFEIRPWDAKGEFIGRKIRCD